MANNELSIDYRRRGSNGTLKLRGIVDIFEVGALHATALRILNDDKVTTVHVILTETERLDVSTVQVLLALKQSAEISGRIFQSTIAPGAVSQQLTRIGVTL